MRERRGCCDHPQNMINKRLFKLSMGQKNETHYYTLHIDSHHLSKWV